MISTRIRPPCGRGIEYAPPVGRRFEYAPLWVFPCVNRFPASRMMRLKECSDSNASTVWDYAGLMCVNNSSRDRDAGPKALPFFSNLYFPICGQHFFDMVQNVADWVAPFPCSQHSPPSPLKFFHTLPSPPTSPPPLPLLRARELGTIIIITSNKTKIVTEDL